MVFGRLLRPTSGKTRKRHCRSDIPLIERCSKLIFDTGPRGELRVSSQGRGSLKGLYGDLKAAFREKGAIHEWDDSEDAIIISSSRLGGRFDAGAINNALPPTRQGFSLSADGNHIAVEIRCSRKGDTVTISAEYDANMRIAIGVVNSYNLKNQ